MPARDDPVRAQQGPARASVARARRGDAVPPGRLDPHVLHALRDRRGLLRPGARRARRRARPAPVADRPADKGRKW